MVRFLAFTVVAFLLPFVFYGGWRFVTAGVVPGREDWSLKLWGRLAAAGVVLMLIAIGVLVSVSGNGEKTTYHPARIENGQLVPGSFD
ncbi:hypothetical protein C3941_06810 [Kaistia algarum]|uniref:DUF6111 family protein n=1 Tax=Kaistia algarum TaxID=2083279 RepID=UPI000CE787DB|nr:DUF6111 family protein [Kaistia algarum]MCX5515614.1 DUF6111 family protein [Kaistia algarum]PPE80995.1 hypothetical protein C3941_06810 [Kaistia algarum]